MIYSSLEKQANAAWKCSWEKFFSYDTHLFYDYLTDNDPAKRYAHLPTPEEIANEIPNRTSWNAGMEDSSINAGIMLEAVINRYQVTHEPEMREAALEIFKGIRTCTHISPVRGFLARSVSPFDGKSFYPESSRDQYTHIVQGLYRFYNSPLCTESERQEIREMLSAFCDFMTETVTPETDYTFATSDGKPACGICKVWNRNAWADARLPMFYAAAWATTGEEKYRQKFEEYANEAVDRTLTMPTITIEGFLQYQIQCSLEVIRDVAVGDEPLRKKCEKAMRMVAELGVFYAWQTRHQEEKTDFSILHTDWREAKDFYGEPPHRIPLFAPEIKRAFEVLRNSFETVIVQFMAPGWQFSDFQKKLMFSRMAEIDFDQCANSGVLYAAAAYWKGRACGAISAEEAEAPL
ncbi:MAG: hypothetical protein IJW23_03580 [Lentisphaeria bacterium]|nr:hypothetical protein [Lentisphaeria bacterium]